MSGTSSHSGEAPGGGLAPLLTLRTLPPLPQFSTPHAVPPPSTPVANLKLSIVRILTGAAGGTGPGSGKTPITMTQAEQIKEMTLHGWRLQMIGLELKQNALIAPESREGAEIQGFDLKDEHECALLEEGDEIVIRILPPFTIQDLKLPSLPKQHVYRAPPASLTRVGTLSAPPAYSTIHPRKPSGRAQRPARQRRVSSASPLVDNAVSEDEEEQAAAPSPPQPPAFPRQRSNRSRTGSEVATPQEEEHQQAEAFMAEHGYVLARPTEPSSHSSSVAANPNVNFHAYDYTRDTSQGWSVMRYNSDTRVVTGAGGTAAKQGKKVAGLKKRQQSFGATPALISPPLSSASSPGLYGIAPFGSGGNSSSNARTEAMNAAARRSSAAQHPMYAAVRQASSTSRDAAAAALPSPQLNEPQAPAPADVTMFNRPLEEKRPPLSRPPASPMLSGSSVTATARASVPSTVGATDILASGYPERDRGEGPSSGLPMTARIIGPGVQGTVGRNLSSPSAPIGSTGTGKQVDAGIARGASNLASFTAATSPILPISNARKDRRQASEDWTESSVAAASPNGHGNDALPRASADGYFARRQSQPTTHGKGQSEETTKPEKEDPKPRKPFFRQISALAGTNLLGQPVSALRKNSNNNNNSKQSGADEPPATETPAVTDGLPRAYELPSLQDLSIGEHRPAFAGYVQDQAQDQLELDAAIAAALADSEEMEEIEPVEKGLPPMPSASTAPVVHNGHVYTAHDPRLSDEQRRRRPSGKSSRRTSNEFTSLSGGSSHQETPHSLGSESASIQRKTKSSQGQAKSSPLAAKLKKIKSSSGILGPIVPPASANDRGVKKAGLSVIQTGSSSKVNASSARDESSANKAEKRYQAFQRELEREKARQAEEEVRRREEVRKREERKKQEAAKHQTDAEKKRIREQWEMWEEVRKREKEAGLPPPAVSNRI